MEQTTRRNQLALAVGGLVLLAGLGLLALPEVGQAGVSLGEPPTPTPTVTATPTPTAIPTPLQPPAAPTNLRIDGIDLLWQDNSDNEDGFRVLWSVDGGPPELLAALPANTTSVSLLALPPHTPIEGCQAGMYSVVAFNEAGESAPAGIAITLTDHCGYEPPPTPSPTSEPAGLPSAGGGPASGGAANDWLLAVGGLGVALAALGGAALVCQRSRSLRS